MAERRPVRPAVARPDHAAQPHHQGRDLRGPHTQARRHARAHRVPPPVRGRRRRHDDRRVLRGDPRRDDRRAPDRARQPRGRRRAARRSPTRCTPRARPIAAQIGHAGPVANPMGTKSPSVAPSRVFSPLGMRRTQARHRVATSRRIDEQFARRRAVLRDAGLRRDRDPHRPRLPAERVPVAEAEPAHRRMGRQPREPGPLPARRSCGPCATRSAATSR